MRNGIIITDTYRRLGWVLLSFLTFLIKVFFAQSGHVRTSATTHQMGKCESVNLGGDHMEATMWKHQLGSDNLEATILGNFSFSSSISTNTFSSAIGLAV